MNAKSLALELLRGSEQYTEDARQGAPVGNSVIGSLLSLQHGIPRQNAEQAVREALAELDREQASAQKASTARHSLPRSGKPALRFSGELLAESDGSRQRGREQNRWHELAVYRTDSNKYIVAIGYRSRWEGEGNHDEATVCDTTADIAKALADYDPTAHVAGYPTGDAYVEKQQRLLADLASRYREQVSEVLAGDEFAEVIQ